MFGLGNLGRTSRPPRIILGNAILVASGLFVFYRASGAWPSRSAIGSSRFPDQALATMAHAAAPGIAP